MIATIFLFLESIGTGELMVIMLFALMFFGSEKIPDIARGLGKGIRQAKDAMNCVQSEITQGMRNVEKQITEELPKIESHPLAQPATKTLFDEKSEIASQLSPEEKIVKDIISSEEKKSE